MLKTTGNYYKIGVKFGLVRMDKISFVFNPLLNAYGNISSSFTAKSESSESKACYRPIINTFRITRSQ